MYILILKKLYIHIFKLIPVSVLILFYRGTPPDRIRTTQKIHFKNYEKYETIKYV